MRLWSLLRRAIRATYWLVTFQLPRRIREERSATALRESGLFDEAHYRAQNPALADPAIDAVVHYVRHGGDEGLSACPLFDAAFYCSTYPDVLESGADPFVHFVQHGVQELRNPNPLFDTAYYLESNPFLKELGLNPLTHYASVGAGSGRDPSPAFQTRGWLEEHPELAATGTNPLVHRLQLEAERRRITEGHGYPLASEGDAPRRDRKIAIVLHLYYTDLWPEIRGYLANLPQNFDLFVSVSENAHHGVEERIREAFPNAQVDSLENRGRDIGPFIAFLANHDYRQYDLICKIHSKKSPHRVDGDRWRGDLLHRLLGHPLIVNEILDVFDRDPGVGILGPANSLDRSRASWGSNKERMTELIERMGPHFDALRLEFFAGSMFWFRPAALEPLANLDLSLADFEGEEGQLDGTLHHALERMFVLSAEAAGYRLHAFERPAQRMLKGATIGDKRVKLIAFYLPQFHPTPENDEWWGNGFTEWHNVAKAKPLFEGHPQPRMPRDLGYYDLRVPETRQAQADLAREYGIHGFCYYYYWFDGRRVLERPLQEVLQSRVPSFPFCICWANENWTRTWDGLENEVLLEQRHSMDSSRAFIRDVIPILKDPRYIRYEGKPVLTIYRPRIIPEIEETTAMWRKECRAAGIRDVHLCAVRFWDTVDVHSLGFDAAVDFPPHHVDALDARAKAAKLDPEFRGWIYDYPHVVDSNLQSRGHGYDKLTHRGVMTAWDNTARRGLDAHLALGATPEHYERWLRGVIEQDLEFNAAGESLVFINAWNEWGEGAVLEPDHHFGSGFLEATRAALEGVASKRGETVEW